MADIRQAWLLDGLLTLIAIWQRICQGLANLNLIWN